MQKRIPVFIMALMAVCHLYAGDVTIMRQLPAAGDNQVQAQWHSPGRNLEATAPAKPTELSGRLDFGGTGKDQGDADPGFDFYTDSRIKLLQALGNNLFIQATADALRRQQLDGTEQQYGGSLLFNHEKIRLDFNGHYRDALVPGATGDLYDQDTLLKAGLYTTFIPNVPITLSGALNWKNKQEAELLTAQNSAASAHLDAKGDLGAFRFSLLSDLSQDNNSLDGINTTGMNGKLALALDALKFLTLQADIIPKYTNTSYTQTGTVFSVTELASQFGLLFPFTEEFQPRVLFGLTDTRQDNPQSETISYQGELGFNLLNLAGFSSAPVYSFSGVVDGSTLHKLAADVSWKPKNIRFVDNLGASAAWQQQLAADNSPVSDEWQWSAGFMLLPLETLSLQTIYNGSLLTTDVQVNKQKVTGQYKHKPVRFFEYAFDADIDYTADALGSRLDTRYGAALTLLPQWNRKVYTFNMKETLGFLNDPAGDILLSKLLFLTAIPVFDPLTVRYSLEWEWTNTVTPGAGPGNAFRHLAGLGLQAAPVTLLCQYALSHGFRGLRHDVLADLALALFKGFSLHSRFELNAYNLETAPVIPFLFGINLIYEF